MRKSLYINTLNLNYFDGLNLTINRIIYHLWSISIWNTYKPCPIQRLIGNLKFKMYTALFETKILQTNSYFKNKQNSD